MMMKKRRDAKPSIGLIIMLVISIPLCGFGQAKARGRSSSRHGKGPPLSVKQNPLMIGRRNINRHQINFFSRQREMALGQQFAARVDRRVRLVTDPVISEYVNRIGQTLVLHSDAADVPFVIKVVAAEEVNAFALPGGFLYLNTGVLRTADNESELAGVMAHEIAHVAARHAMENISKSQLFSLASTPLVFLGGGLGVLARNSANFGLTTALFRFSRKAEREADVLGVQYLWAAGYDPNGLVTFFEKLQRQERRPRVSPLFRTHPATPDRIAVVRRLIARYPERRTSIVSSTDFTRVKGRLLAWSGRGRVENAAQSGRRRRVLHRPADGQAHGAPVGTPSPPSPTGESLPRRPTLRRRPPSADGTARVSPASRASETTGGPLQRDPPTLRHQPSPQPMSDRASPETVDERAGSVPPRVLHRRPQEQDPRQRPKLRRRSPANPPSETHHGPPTLRRRRP